MPPSSSESPVVNAARQHGPQAAELPASVASKALSTWDLSGCHSAVLLATVVYVTALGAAAALDAATPILDGVLLYLLAAGFLGCYGRVFFPQLDRLVLLLEAACIVVALGLSLACLSYLGAMTALPLRDPEMIWVDRHLGFDWLQVMRALDHRRFLLMVLDGAYATFTAQLIGTVLVLVVAGRTRELDRFFATFICASVLAEFASVLAPTLGPMLTVARDASFLHLPTLGRATGQIVIALRNGSLRAIDLKAIDGIISFPSLHAAVAVIVPYTLRRYKPLFWPILCLNVVMFVSAIPSGNHYLADVLGGLAVAALAIPCAARVQHIADRIIGRRAAPAAAR